MSTHKKTNELLLAARQGDYNLVSNLIALYGKNIVNSQDHLGTSALHLAVIHGHQDIVKLLTSQLGVNTNLQAYKDIDLGITYSPLDMAIKYRQPIEMVQVLLDSGGSTKYPTNLLFMLFENSIDSEIVNCEEKPNYTSFEKVITQLDILVKKIPSMIYVKGTPLATILHQMNCYIGDPEEKMLMQETIEVLLENDPQHYTQAFLLAKNFTHAFPSGNKYPTINIYSNDLISAEGHFTSSAVKSFHDSLSDYQLGLPQSESALKKNIFSEVNASFYIAERAILNAGSYDVSKMLFTLYEEGRTLLLPTGWQGHAVDIILDKSLGLYVVANAGERYLTLPPGVKAYNNLLPISADDIYKILNNQDEFNLEYDHYYKLSLVNNNDFSQNFAEQLYGNCALNSLLLANWSLQYIYLYKAVNDPKLAKQIADSWHQDMVEHHKTVSLKNYLSHPYLKDDKPLYDALTKYEAKLDHPEKIEQTHLFLDYLTSPDHLPGFKHFYKKHPSDFTPELKQFIQKNGYGETIQIGDVFSNMSLKTALETKGDNLFFQEKIQSYNMDVFLNHTSTYTDIYI